MTAGLPAAAVLRGRQFVLPVLRPEVEEPRVLRIDDAIAASDETAKDLVISEFIFVLHVNHLLSVAL